jgi:hypothetical protein
MQVVENKKMFPERPTCASIALDKQSCSNCDSKWFSSYKGIN